MKKICQKYRREIALFLYGCTIFYLIPAIVTLCGGKADAELYILLAVLLPEAAAVITYVTVQRRYLFPTLCMSLLPAGYGVFFYPWHAEIWYSYMPDMEMCLFMGALMAFFHIFIVLILLLLGALIGGIADWDEEHRHRKNKDKLSK